MDEEYFDYNQSAGQGNHSNRDYTGSSPKIIGLRTFESAFLTNAEILDCRPPSLEENKFIPGSIRLHLTPEFKRNLNLVKPSIKTSMAALASPKDYNKVASFIRSSGLNFLGFLDGGMDAWVNAGKPFNDFLYLNKEDAINMVMDQEAVILSIITDITVPFYDYAKAIPIDELLIHIEALDLETIYIINSPSPELSEMVFSLLIKKEFKNLYIIEGTFPNN